MPYRLASGYVQLNDVKHRKQYEHRCVWEETNGSIPEGLEIHHKNARKSDNRIENLELLTKVAHVRKHPMSEEHKEKRGARFRALWASGIFQPHCNEKHGMWRDLPLSQLLNLFDQGYSPNRIAKIMEVDKSIIQKRLNMYRECDYAL